MANARSKRITIGDVLVIVEEQLYEIPGNWCWVKIGGISDVYTGNSINERVKKEKYEGKTDGPLFIATKDVDFDNTINYETNIRITDPENFKKAPAFTSLLCIEGGSAGRKIGFTNQEVCFGNKLCAFSSKNVEAKYIFYYLQSNAFTNQFNERKHGLIGGVSVKDLAEIAIPLPPLSEQKRIVEQIESLFSKLDEANEKAEYVLEYYKERRLAIIHKAYSGELTSKWRVKQKTSLDDRSFRQIKGICKSLKYGTANKSEQEGEVVVLRMGNLQEGEIDWADLAYSSDPDDIKKYSLVKGDVLFNRTNSPEWVGKTSIYRGEYPAIYAGYLIKLDYDHEVIDGEYLNYMLNSLKAKEYCNSVKSDGVNQSNINAQKIGAFSIPVPSLTEQKEIVRILDQTLDKEKQIKNIAEETIKGIASVKKAILAKAFRGELGTNNSADESSVELLKQVLDVQLPVERKMKGSAISAGLLKKGQNNIERSIISYICKNDNTAVSIESLMSISSDKFGIIEALRQLENKGVIRKINNDYYKMVKENYAD